MNISRACQLLELPRSSYYERLTRTDSNRTMENKQLSDRIMRIYLESGRRYGAPKIHQALAKQQINISLKRVQKLMRQLAIQSIIIKKWRPGHSTSERIQERANLLKRDFSTTGLNQKWVTDITYIHTVKDGWCYLSSIQDIHSKKIIAWSFGKRMTTDLVLDTLDKAVQTQQATKDLIIHSDLGSQYTSESYGTRLNELNIRHSFSGKGCPYDNAGIESFHATLKKEEVYQTSYQTIEEASRRLFQYIEGFYNRKRLHGSINYLTPQEMEDRAKQVA